LFANVGGTKYAIREIVSARYYLNTPRENYTNAGRIYVKLGGEDERYTAFEHANELELEWASFVKKGALQVVRQSRNEGRAVKGMKKGGFNMEWVKSYFNKHQDQIMTLGIIILLDHVIFEGMFRDRLKGLVDKMIGATEKQLAGGTDGKYTSQENRVVAVLVRACVRQEGIALVLAHILLGNRRHNGVSIICHMMKRSFRSQRT